MSNYTFSVIIHAHNEEKYIGKCVKAVKRASARVDDGGQIIVSANRCTDNTAEIAAAMGAEVCDNTVKCISVVRNDGAQCYSHNEEKQGGSYGWNVLVLP